MKLDRWYFLYVHDGRSFCHSDSLFCQVMNIGCVPAGGRIVLMASVASLATGEYSVWVAIELTHFR